MNRTPLLNQLKTYLLKFPEEKTSVEKIIHFIKTHTDCFERTQLSGHITGSAFLLSHNSTQTLLTHHAKLKQWLQLGGHADGEHDILEVAKREAQEESGIFEITPLSTEILDVDVHDIPAHGDTPAHVHYDIRYLFKVASPEAKISMSGESLDLKWFGARELTSGLVDSSVLRLAKKGFGWCAQQESNPRPPGSKPGTLSN